MTCCIRCWKEEAATKYFGGQALVFRPFIVCATCGNKRCPHATDHRLKCTNSNESGQPGSVYGTKLDT